MNTIVLSTQKPGFSQVQFEGQCLAQHQDANATYRLYQDVNDDWIGHIHPNNQTPAHTEPLDDEFDLLQFFGPSVSFSLLKSLQESPITCLGYRQEVA
ncbi:hypothetical protein [Vibrio sp. 10N.261.46.A3]|uniref:hypothetical protein n=1 Tax=Vibrio sp. 10N.261.46.A3 TaxID=3229658 RepID=UPI00354B1D2E